MKKLAFVIITVSLLLFTTQSYAETIYRTGPDGIERPIYIIKGDGAIFITDQNGRMTSGTYHPQPDGTTNYYLTDPQGRTSYQTGSDILILPPLD